ncbi:MAG: RluA family pseudouridine synthase [Christensenellales bacterium]
MKRLELVASEKCELKKFLMREGLDFLCVQKLFRKRDVKVNGKRVSQSVCLDVGDKVECFVEEYAKDRSIEKLFEDDNMVVVCKPCGVEVCGEGSMEEILGAFAVNRLDRNTSGVMIFAKNEDARVALDKVFRKGLVHKHYVCEVVGSSCFDGEMIEAYLFKNAKKAKVLISDKPKPNYVKIKTIFETLENREQSSLVHCTLITGKTHQIRAQLAHLGYPIVGDNKYGDKATNRTFGAKYQRLCCVELACDNWGNMNFLTAKDKGLLKNICGKRFSIEAKFE